MALFDTVVLSEGFFGANNLKIKCAAPLNFENGQRIVYGTEDGVYISDQHEVSKDPIKVLALLEVSQIDVLEDYQLLVVLSEREVLTFPLDALDPMDHTAGLKQAKRISTDTSFFKVGRCLDRVLVTIVRPKPSRTVFKVFQYTNGTLKPFREFFIAVEATSMHYLKTRICVGASKGFEVVDLESLETQGLLDPADKSLDFVLKPKPRLRFFTSARDVSRPMAIYRVNADFLLCYDQFAFYINKSGQRSRNEFMVTWKEKPTGFAFHRPYLLAFLPSYVEIRHIETGLVSQMIPGSNVRLLFADTPPSVDNGGGDGHGQPTDGLQNGDEILMTSEDRIIAVRLAACGQGEVHA